MLNGIGVQEQGRAAAARRGRRLPAVARSTCPPVKGIDLKGNEELERKADDNEPFAALAFKIMTDPHVGKLTYFRVYSRHARQGRPGAQHPHRPARSASAASSQMHANHREDLDAVFAGDIVAGIGLKNTTHRRHALRPRTHPIVLEALEFPEPVIHVAVEPKTKADQDKMGKALYSLSEEDPTFQVRTDEETGQTVISGMGELHLEVLVDRMLREFKVDATVGKPQVAYRETITQTGREVHATPTRSRPVARASTPTSSSTSSPPAPAAATSSSTRSPAVASRRSTSPRSTRASRRR